MDRGRVIHLLAEAYVFALLAGVTLTVAWLLAADVPTGRPNLRASGSPSAGSVYCSS